VESSLITEVLEIVLYMRNPTILCVINGSGDLAQRYALKLDGELVATYTLAGVDAVDWDKGRYSAILQTSSPLNTLSSSLTSTGFCKISSQMPL